MSRPIFVAAWFSPWSERARFALDHHRLAWRDKLYAERRSVPGTASTASA